MPVPSIEACFYVREPTEFEFRDGMFHAYQCIGNYRFERVMSPHIFALSVRRANEVLAAYRVGANVVEIKGRAAGH